MKKVLILSDLALEGLVKQIESKDYSFEICFAEDIIAELLKLNAEKNLANCLYIHLDNYFKFYQDEKITQLIKLIRQVSQNYKFVLISNLIFLNKTYSVLSQHLTTTFDTKYYSGIQRLQNTKNIFFVDNINSILQLGTNETYNFNLGYLYQMPYKKRFIEDFKTSLIDSLDKIFKEEKKVIVVDCDNTLWNGIVGENGVENIRCDSSVKGIIYQQFQLFLKSKLAEGFVLCICSKNNLIDVESAFQQKNFPLKFEDFTIRKINWHDKVNNLNEIANELQVNLNSFVFIDDSEFELNSVKEILPMVECFLFQNNPEAFHQLINSFHFKKKIITAEDAKKSQLYEQENKRKAIIDNSLSLEDYIKKLNIKLDIKKNFVKDFERLSQMTSKTNQFNFNKKAYSVNELNQIIQKGGIIYSCSASDTYGDYGIIGLAIIHIDKQNDCRMENMLLSCRALGREIENLFYKFIDEDLKKENKKITQIEFKKTDRNLPAEHFYKQIKQI
ncbi:MAG TPA: HAD-IIIC family phosphatase [Pyrinomonadaceae bacterium]|nr:HAD-IIIC family phosphatase [Pyrinomonadaceae bacterium]